ncbi:serine/threonine protein kinase [Aquabacterium sp. A7-Y]|uniref:serine/threonine-protein kinase n=1 Tax=Aquabacterium sp. A7-Y TaxID=1349605 RepID=UPI00223DDC81|nr:serine/threonine-protein kinase [Aquabacterium sp. A7-Y]MCW7541362.1 serine/threonine protein kinase [Aquabacterium sp. A7-Y]
MHGKEDLRSVETRPDPGQWQRVKHLLAEAMERSTSGRRELVARVSADEAKLGKELQSLLDVAAVSSSVLDRPISALVRVLREAHESSRTGQRLGPYRIVALIGRGGMADVYRAERTDGVLEQQVAIKLMRDSFFDREHLLSRFCTERQILASLDHPNLTRVFDDGVTDDGRPYLVMELVDGEPIDVYAERRKLSIDQRLRMFGTVCQVVHYAHQMGVVHRDLKPGNILVSTEGIVKLLDFGIAKQIAGDPHTVTRTADRVLTLAYASPEQVRGEQITPASDVYSLGLVLYHLLTGTSPYCRVFPASEYELGKAICDSKPQPPSRAATTSADDRRRLQGDLDAVVLKALRKDPGQRYASAEHFAEDLFRHLERLPVWARQGAWRYRTGRLRLCQRAVTGAASIARLALAPRLVLAVIRGCRRSSARVTAASGRC